jgi:hypothetical protein
MISVHDFLTPSQLPKITVNETKDSWKRQTTKIIENSLPKEAELCSVARTKPFCGITH